MALAQSWNLLGGYAGQITLGHAAFFGLGALATRVLWVNGAPLVLALVAGAFVSTVFGVLIGLPAFRLRGAYFAIGTLGLAEILRIRRKPHAGNFDDFPSLRLRPTVVLSRYYLTLGLAVLSCRYSRRRANSLAGRAWIQAVREDEAAAEVLQALGAPRQQAAGAGADGSVGPSCSTDPRPTTT